MVINKNEKKLVLKRDENANDLLGDSTKHSHLLSI